MEKTAIYRARDEDLVVQELGNELLIYDRRTDVAHCLTETAASVWQACGQGATLDQLADSLVARTDASLGSREDAEAMVLRAIGELEEKGLLAGDVAPGNVSRRQALGRMAGVGAGVLVAPLVVSAAVPKTAEAFGSPLTCGSPNAGSATKNCSTKACGTSSTNTCCNAGVSGCPAAVGTGLGGCWCDGSHCQNCVAKDANPPAGCPDGTCSGHTGSVRSNCCCCSGECSATKDACV